MKVLKKYKDILLFFLGVFILLLLSAISAGLIEKQNEQSTQQQSSTQSEGLNR